MADRELYLTALLPPGNVVEALEKARYSLRSRMGPIPVRSLPPSIILSVDEGNPGSLVVVDAAEYCAGLFRTTDWLFRGSSIFLGINPAPRIAAALPIVPRPRTETVPAFPPPPPDRRPGDGPEAFPGIWMAPLLAEGRKPEPPPILSWGISVIVLMRVILREEPWWKAVYWEILAERRTRRSVSTTP